MLSIYNANRTPSFELELSMSYIKETPYLSRNVRGREAGKLSITDLSKKKVKIADLPSIV